MEGTEKVQYICKYAHITAHCPIGLASLVDFNEAFKKFDAKDVETEGLL